jgi:hypothetical protein
MDGTVVGRSLLGRIVWFGAEVEMATNTTFGLRLGQIGSVAVDPKDHVAGDVSYNSIRVSDSIVKEVGKCFRSSFGAFGLG